MKYNPNEIEARWQKYWADEKTFVAQNDSRLPKYYVLDMFPYPSGAGLHVGHPLGYIASDIVARYKRHSGFNVLHPQGYDSFGLPAEQYAIQTGQHPEKTTRENIARYREQLDRIGFSFDWDREVRTSDPDYYRWTQWIFIQLFNSWYNKDADRAESICTLIQRFEKDGNANVDAACDDNVSVFSADEWSAFSDAEQQKILLKYRMTYLAEAEVNWCPGLGTVLANDEIVNGVSERGGFPVIRKKMTQWSMRISAYAQRLLDGLGEIDWTQSLKDAQEHWIGKSVGASVTFNLKVSDKKIKIFTTRPDTIFGATFMTLAPEHELVRQITTPEQKADVNAYVEATAKRSERERMADVKSISGVFTGAFAEHPFTKEPIPVWIGDYVLAGYGTGAVMAVPAGDERDFAFAKHFGLEITNIFKLDSAASGESQAAMDEAYIQKSGFKFINSDFLNGTGYKSATTRVIDELEKIGHGKGKTNFRLRDAVFSRQRYWGEPFPVYYADGLPQMIDAKYLPIRLPEVEKYLPTEDGAPPLGNSKEWAWNILENKVVENDLIDHKTVFPLELNTMPGWAGSSWYWLRYMDPKNENEFVSKDAEAYWQNVDLYIGGSEHATGHLLYSRFWNKFLKDRGFVNCEEPFKKLINQGMILGMSAFVPRVEAAIYGLKNISINRKGEKLLEFDGEVYHGRSKELFVSRDILLTLIDEKRLRDLSSSAFNFYYDPSKSDPIYDYIKQNEWFTEDQLFAVNEVRAILEYQVWPFRYDVNKISSSDEVNSLDEFKNWSGWQDPIFLTVNNRFVLERAVEKMSKSKYNVVNPDDICNEFGADTLRLYEMFLGPLEQAKPWNTAGITGVFGFLKKLWRLYFDDNGIIVTDNPAGRESLKTLHKTIKKVHDDIENFSFNTSVSQFMICVNELSAQNCHEREILEPLAILISPYAPHIAEELWSKLGHENSISRVAFPEFNPAHLIETNKEYPVSFNGKMKFTIGLPLDLSKEEIEKIVLADERTKKQLDGRQPNKVIIVPGKIINLVS